MSDLDKLESKAAAEFLPELIAVADVAREILVLVDANQTPIVDLPRLRVALDALDAKIAGLE